MHSFEQFVATFTSEFNRRGLPVRRDTSLLDDLGFDSFDAVRLLLFLEDLAEVLVPPSDTPIILTVGNAYAYYCDLLRQPQVHAADR